MMPGLSGLEITRQVKKRSPQTHVVILSMHRDESYVLEALKNGAAAYVLKDSSVAELIKAVKESLAGRRYLPPLSQCAIDAYVKKALVTGTDSYESLTGREREVLQLAAEGRATRCLLISKYGFVENHCRSCACANIP
jgi:two-component system, NarL family, response regulator NreC